MKKHKRIITVFIFGAILSGQVLCTASELPQTNESMYNQDADNCLIAGNVNATDLLSLNDAQAVLKYSLKISNPSESQRFLADYDGDGQITLQDASATLKASLKITKEKYINELPTSLTDSTFFIEDMGSQEYADEVILIHSKDELTNYQKKYGENYQADIFKKYAGFFDNNPEVTDGIQHLLTITHVKVNTDDRNQVTYHSYKNESHIGIEIFQNTYDKLKTNHYLTVINKVLIPVNQIIPTTSLWMTGNTEL